MGNGGIQVRSCRASVLSSNIKQEIMGSDHCATYKGNTHIKELAADWWNMRLLGGKDKD